MKNFLFLILATLFSASTFAQTQITRSGKVQFYSDAKLEKIKAVTNEAKSILNTSTGDLAFELENVGFKFENALMQEHFNENYMESKKFPKSTFKGKIADLSKVNFTQDGTYDVTVAGDLTMHGVTNKVSTPGTITVKAGKISAKAIFDVKLADYKIAVPTAVFQKIAETVKITVNCKYEPKN